MSERERILKLINPIRYSTTGSFDVGFEDIERTVENLNNLLPLDLNPEFQRGHVWTHEQSVAYIEALFMNKLSKQAKIISFNRTGYSKQINENSSDYDERLTNKMLCIDGLQRLTALLNFIRNPEFCVFPETEKELGYKLNYETMKQHRALWDLDYYIRFEFYEFDTYAELLKFYLDFNSGGTVHSDEEIQRISEMYKAEIK